MLVYIIKTDVHLSLVGTGYSVYVTQYGIISRYSFKIPTKLKTNDIFFKTMQYNDSFLLSIAKLKGFDLISALLVLNLTSVLILIHYDDL